MVRKATLADSDAILHCLAEAFAPFREEYSPEAFTDTVLTRETLAERFQRMTIYVAEVEGRIVGTIAGLYLPEKRKGHIRGMAVVPQYQGQGVAEQLLMSVEAGLSAAGATRITLNTTAPLQRAMRFYERNGYQPTGRSRDFFGMTLYEYAKQA